ncbi:TraR/DksA C4-type zinc finger protein [Clostridium sp. 19966]|uniref:TraR/DksA C4-type zinc finger protein n=1 Tax=Clostridium sp. 19966 TaxID=2768166 RepID=UPI0028DDF326|nr:TraR/DksA C4-type zinc finger protein [Clostridium sp. 19966]MDT8716610.1 TraR/DksA C4-type zinc finger protein [Clostridium sp. 19966]
MDNNRLNFYKNALLKERKRIEDLIEQLKRNQVIGTNFEASSELSFYDNHPGDLASEMNDLERGRAFENNEIAILEKIEDALKSIGKGDYGICKNCGDKISEERLNFILYTRYCIKCQNTISDMAETRDLYRNETQNYLLKPFGYGHDDYHEQLIFDGEDTYQAVDKFNKLKNVYEYFEENEEEGYVEPIEKISNDQYRSQLPD